MITGIPNNEVMVFTGSIIPLRATTSQTNVQSNIDSAPHNIAAGISTRWSAVRNVIRATWGIAKPMKPIGPQNAVIVPARSVVERNIRARERLTLRPIVRAYASPRSNIFSDLMTTTASTTPTTTTGTITHNCSTVTVATEPIVHTTKDFRASSLPIYCNIPTTADIAEESIIPTMSMVFILRILRDRDITSRSISAEPNHATPVTPTDTSHGIAAMPNIGVANVKSATPRLAPEFTPKT
jgi:hypothetical protein